MHEISNNVVCATSKGSDQPAHTRSLIRAFARCLNILSVKLLTEHLMEVLSLKGGCTCSSESTLVKLPHCWKSRVTAHVITEVSKLAGVRLDTVSVYATEHGILSEVCTVKKNTIFMDRNEFKVLFPRIVYN